MASKNLVNQSGKDLTVSLITRTGSDPANSGETVSTTVPNGQRKTVEYGNDANPYLNAVTIVWKDDGSVAEQSQTVTVRGSAWDDTLNTNDTLTIAGTDDPRVTGSNS